MSPGPHLPDMYVFERLLMATVGLAIAVDIELWLGLMATVKLAEELCRFASRIWDWILAEPFSFPTE